MALELTGKLIKVLPEVTGQGKNGPWSKQEFVIETFDQFPKKVAMTAWGEKANDLKQFATGDTLRVQLNLESREYNERWYTEARAWRIEAAEGEGGAPYGTPTARPAASSAGTTSFNAPSFDDESNDLPF